MPSKLSRLILNQSPSGNEDLTVINQDLKDRKAQDNQGH